MEDYPQEGALRGGHIPGAQRPLEARGQRGRHVQDRRGAQGDLRGRGRPEADDDVIAYCRIGERSSLTWFVLTYLLGVPQGPQLRRLVDRVGQRCEGADRTLIQRFL